MKETKFMKELHRIREDMSKMNKKERDNLLKTVRIKYKDLIKNNNA